MAVHILCETLSARMLVTRHKLEAFSSGLAWSGKKTTHPARCCQSGSVADGEGSGWSTTLAVRCSSLQASFRRGGHQLGELAAGPLELRWGVGPPVDPWLSEGNLKFKGTPMPQNVAGFSRWNRIKSLNTRTPNYG